MAIDLTKYPYTITSINIICACGKAVSTAYPGSDKCPYCGRKI